MKLEVGDILYCHTTGRMNYGGEVFAYKGNEYEVTKRSGDDIWINTELTFYHLWWGDSDIYEFFNVDYQLIRKKIKKHKMIAI